MSCVTFKLGIFGQCRKEYVRNTDFLRHRIKCHQPVILNQTHDNITTVSTITNTANGDHVIMHKPPRQPPTTSSTTGFNIESTTKLFNGKITSCSNSIQTSKALTQEARNPTPTPRSETDCYSILANDLLVIDSDNDSQKPDHSSH